MVRVGTKVHQEKEKRDASSYRVGIMQTMRQLERGLLLVI